MPSQDANLKMQPSDSATREIKSPACHDASPQGQYDTSGQDLSQSITGRLDSTTLQLYHSVRPLSKASMDSFYTAGEGSNDSQMTQIAGVAQSTPVLERVDMAKTFATRAWQEDPNFVEPEELVEWFAFPSDIRQQALGYYMACFDFSNMSIDESIRSLCSKLHVKGGGQQIDKILGIFSERYISQNPSSVWRLEKIVHIISLAIILLDTHLQATEFGPRIPSSRFADNTVRAIRGQMGQEGTFLNTPSSSGTSSMPKSLRDIDKFSRMPSALYDTSSSNASSSPTFGQRFIETRNWFSRIAGGAAPSDDDSWIAVTAVSDAEERASKVVELNEHWEAEISLALAAVYNRVQARPIIIRTRNDEASTSLFTYESRSSFISTVGYASSLPTASTAQCLEIVPNSSPGSLSSANLSHIGPHWAKTGPLLWKSMKPTSGRIAKPKRWRSVIATVQNSQFYMIKPAVPGSATGTGRQLGTLSLLHTLALEVPAPKGFKVRSFGLTLASGETHIFEIQAVSSILSMSKSKSGPNPDAEVLAWVRACNRYAACYSCAPLPEVATDTEYGWSRVREYSDDYYYDHMFNDVVIDDWVAPTLPHVEAQTGLEAQLEMWNGQVEMYNTEFAEHGELRGRMMSLYRPGSAQAQKALSNWEKKAQYLLTEIVKYETYAEILNNAEKYMVSRPSE